MNLLEMFIITNGRSTFDLVLKSAREQTVDISVTVIRNMKWIDALNQCLSESKSRFYFRVDDDVFLHPMAVEYYQYCLQNGKKTWGVYECKLWEDWTHKPAGSLKAYNTEIAREIGFHPNRFGKVDKVFSADLPKHGCKRVKDNSMVGLHSCATVDDQKRYRKLWRDNNASVDKNIFSKTFDNIIHIPHKTVQEQYNDIGKLKVINRKYKTNFFKLLKVKKI